MVSPVPSPIPGSRRLSPRAGRRSRAGASAPGGGALGLLGGVTLGRLSDVGFGGFLEGGLAWAFFFCFWAVFGGFLGWERGGLLVAFKWFLPCFDMFLCVFLMEAIGGYRPTPLAAVR